MGAYVVAFVFLGLHLAHGFTSAFQSVEATAGRKKTLQNIGKAYSIIIPLGFIFIALYHHFKPLIVNIMALDSKVPQGPIER